MGLMISFVLAFQFLVDGGNQNQVLKIVEVASNQDINIKEWKVYIKQPVINVTTKEAIEEEVLNIMNAHPSYKWKDEIEEGKHHYARFGYKYSHFNDIKEKMTITVFNKGPIYKIFTSFEITGGKWNNQTWDFLNSTYNTELENDMVYFTVYGTKDINKSMILEEEASKLLNAFSADEVEGMKENNFISSSAYVNEWQMEIPTKGKEVFNLQFGLRLDPSEEHLNVVIGTPFISSGY